MKSFLSFFFQKMEWRKTLVEKYEIYDFLILFPLAHTLLYARTCCREPSWYAAPLSPHHLHTLTSNPFRKPASSTLILKTVDGATNMLVIWNCQDERLGVRRVWKEKMEMASGCVSDVAVPEIIDKLRCGDKASR